jgi:hypothetical protein
VALVTSAQVTAVAEEMPPVETMGD